MDINDILKDLERNVTDGRSSKANQTQQKQEEYQQFVQAWISERTAPELLPYQQQLIDSILKRLREQIEIIELNSIELESSDADIKLKLLIIENEIERVNFLVRSYLRCRLSKIDKFSIYINNNLDEMEKLSHNELKYMNQHFKILLELYSHSFLDRLPEHLRSLDDTSGGISMISEPNFNKFVFIRVVSDKARPVRFGDHEIVLDKDDVHTVQYKFIKIQLEDGDVVLI